MVVKLDQNLVEIWRKKSRMRNFGPRGSFSVIGMHVNFFDYLLDSFLSLIGPVGAPKAPYIAVFHLQCLLTLNGMKEL